jgi:enoyl-CoA hydratase/carnithine racemase
MSDPVQLEVTEHVAVITLVNPPMNVLALATQALLWDISQEVCQRSDVRAVLFTGGDRVFCAGADVKEMQGKSHQQLTDESYGERNAWRAIAAIPKPTIASIAGFALGGGCELALCCDLRIAADTARFGQPEVLLGLIPGAGGTQRLSRLIGVGRAKELIYSGRIIDAQEALAIGLVNRVVPAAELAEVALDWAQQFARGPKYTLRAAKEAIDRGIEVDLDTGLEIERLQASALMSTSDPHIGIASFIESGPGKANFLSATD